MRRGRTAITALAAYREAKAQGNEEAAAQQTAILKENFPYFGYGYIKDEAELVPHIPLNFWTFRIMVGFGTLFVLFFALLVFQSYKNTGIFAPGTLYTKRSALTSALLWLSIILIPCAYIASECGWLVAELGRQPWTI